MSLVLINLGRRNRERRNQGPRNRERRNRGPRNQERKNQERRNQGPRKHSSIKKHILFFYLIKYVIAINRLCA